MLLHVKYAILLHLRTKYADVYGKAAMLKWDWTGHVCHMLHDLWSKVITEWIPETRLRGRPPTKWRNDDRKANTSNWPKAMEGGKGNLHPIMGQHRLKL